MPVRSSFTKIKTVRYICFTQYLEGTRAFLLILTDSSAGNRPAKT